MDGRARWYRLRMCRPASYQQHSRSASFDAGGSGGGVGGGSGRASQFHGGPDESLGTGRHRTTTAAAGDGKSRPASGGAGRVGTYPRSSAASDVIHLLPVVFDPVRDNYNLKSHKYLCTTTYQRDTSPDPNPTTKQHAIVNTQLNRPIVKCPTYPDKFIRDMLLHRLFDFIGCNCHTACSAGFPRNLSVPWAPARGSADGQ